MRQKAATEQRADAPELSDRAQWPTNFAILSLAAFAKKNSARLIIICSGGHFGFFFFVLFTAPGTKRARSVLDVRGRKSISIIEIFFNENDTFYKLSEIDSSPY